MKRFGICALLVAVVFSAQAGRLWPFGSDDSADTHKARLSALMEPASLLIDEATDLAADGKVSDAIDKYRSALDELDRIESENPERAKSPEFATLRNKRAYVNAAIDSMLMSQVKSNAKVVAVSDTTALEKRLAEEKAKAKKAKDEDAKAKAKAEEKAKGEDAKAKSGAVQLIVNDISSGKFAAADAAIAKMLADKPDNAAALNLKALSEMCQGKDDEAERTLDKAIMTSPRSYQAYYNMADLLLKKGPDGKVAAKRYYETGRTVGGPVDEVLEAALK